MSTHPAALTRAFPVRARSVMIVAGAVLLAGALIVLRLRQAHPAPLYPDGYQYLLMAQGLVEDGRPLLQLGPEGDVLGPSIDAAAKPLYPALVALLSLVGLSTTSAAHILAALSAAALPMIVGLLSWQLFGGSWRAGLAAASVAVASPAVAFWLGFPGPDALALCLAAGAALGFARRRGVVGGVLCGLCAVTRPELVALMFVAFVAAIASPAARRQAGRALVAAGITGCAVIAAVRPPLPSADLRLTVIGAALGIAVGGAALVSILWRHRRAGALPALAIAAVPLALAVRRGGAGWSEVGRTDMPLLVLIGGCLAVAIWRREHRAVATCAVIAVATMAAIYAIKNPGAARYVSFLIPIAAVVAGAGVASLPRRFQSSALAAVVACGMLASAVASPPNVGRDMFPAIAAELRGLPQGAIVTAAPDAYGVLLRSRTIRPMDAGRRGLIVIDPVARAYEPNLRASGRVVARIPSDVGLLRPDGRIDREPVIVTDGVVVEG